MLQHGRRLRLEGEALAELLDSIGIVDLHKRRLDSRISDSRLTSVQPRAQQLGMSTTIHCCAKQAISDHNYVAVGEMAMFEAAADDRAQTLEPFHAALVCRAPAADRGHGCIELLQQFITPSDVDLGFPHSLGRNPLSISRRLDRSRQSASPGTEARLARKADSRSPSRRSLSPSRKRLPQRRQADAPLQTARGGSFFGHVPGSPLTGDEVVPAFPDVYPDPPVSRGDLPSGVQGDVIVEVTIDPQGQCR